MALEGRMIRRKEKIQMILLICGLIKKHSKPAEPDPLVYKTEFTMGVRWKRW